MSKQVSTEVIFKNEELLVKRVLGCATILLFDHLLPHTHELPFLELLEEAQLLNMVVRVTLNEPLTERNEFNRGVTLVESQTKES
jgi:hypothetical protein